MNRKIAVVTGAPSGTGEAIATRLWQAGYKVYGASPQGARVGPSNYEMLALDVTCDASVQAAIATVMRRVEFRHQLCDRWIYGIAGL